MRSGRPTVLDQRKERRALSQAPIDRIQAPAADMAVAIATSAKALQHAVITSCAVGRAVGWGLIISCITRPSSSLQPAGGGTSPERKTSHRSPLPGSGSPLLISKSMIPKEKMSAAVDGLDSSRSRLR